MQVFWCILIVGLMKNKGKSYCMLISNICLINPIIPNIAMPELVETLVQASLHHTVNLRCAFIIYVLLVTGCMEEIYLF